MTEIWQLAKWRFFLLRRQRLGIAAAALGLLAVLLIFAVASSSYLYPEKVYWDFALGLAFAFITFLSVFVASALFADERQRRTLHLLLASGVSRRAWIWGNFIGLLSANLLLLAIWSLGAWAVSTMISTRSVELLLVLQSQLAFGFELLILIAMSMSLSFFLRPLLALLLSLVLIVFLHSQVSLLSVLGDAQTGAFNNPVLLPILQWIVPVLPPLEWYDLRVLVGYESSITWAKLAGLLGMAIAWTVFWIELALWKFNRTDL